jgi:hypothetical protein
LLLLALARRRLPRYLTPRAPANRRRRG